MRLISIFLWAFLAIMPFAGHAQEAEKGMIVTPKRVVFAEGEKLQELTIANRGTATQKYRISLVNRKMNESGALEETATPAEGEFFATDVLRYGPRQIELGPKQTQKIRLMSRMTADAAPGEYRSHVLVQEVPEPTAAQKADGSSADGTLGINVQSIYGISVPVFLRKGELTATTALSGGALAKRDGQTFVDIDVSREGTRSPFGTLTVFDGTTQVAILKGVAVYLSTPKRRVSIPVPEEYAAGLSGKTLRVTYGVSEPEEDAPESETSFTAQ